MSMMSKKKTTEQVISAATTKITDDVAHLNLMRENAVKTVRQTAQSLQANNEELQASVERFSILENFARGKREECVRAIEDNNKVREKILEIIGEE